MPTVVTIEAVVSRKGGQPQNRVPESNLRRLNASGLRATFSVGDADISSAVVIFGTDDIRRWGSIMRTNVLAGSTKDVAWLERNVSGEKPKQY